MDVSAGVWQDISLRGHGAARQSYAEASTKARELELELARRDAVARAMQSWVDARHGRELLVLREQSAELAVRMRSIAQVRVRDGSAPPLEESLATSVYGQARAAVIDAEGMVVEADASLRHALGLGATVPIRPVGELSRTDDRQVDEAVALALVMKGHPAIRLARARAHEAEQHARLATSLAGPVLGVGLTYSHEATGDRVLGGVVSVPLPLVDPGAFDAARARGEATVEREHGDEVALLLEREIRLALHEREHAREMRDALQSMAIEPGRRALQEILRRYAAGAVGISETLAARRELLMAEESYLAACADVQRADIRLEHAVGGALPRKETR